MTHCLMLSKVRKKMTRTSWKSINVTIINWIQETQIHRLGLLMRSATQLASDLDRLADFLPILILIKIFGLDTRLILIKKVKSPMEKIQDITSLDRH
jgi:hypothetical protein